MEFQDKEKYHEIHPVKLATDISAAALSLYLFWQHALISGILVAIVPSVIVSIVINIQWRKRSILKIPLTVYPS
jgi:hypothetical protein